MVSFFSRALALFLVTALKGTVGSSNLIARSTRIRPPRSAGAARKIAAGFNGVYLLFNFSGFKLLGVSSLTQIGFVRE